MKYITIEITGAFISLILTVHTKISLLSATVDLINCKQKRNYAIFETKVLTIGTGVPTTRPNLRALARRG